MIERTCDLGLKGRGGGRLRIKDILGGGNRMGKGQANTGHIQWVRRGPAYNTGSKD